MVMRRLNTWVTVVIVFLCLGDDSLGAQYGATNGEWRSYAGDVGSTKYSPLEEITAANFKELQIRWHWTSIDSHLVHDSGNGASRVEADTVFELLQAKEPDLWTAWDGVTQTRSGRPCAV